MLAREQCPGESLPLLIIGSFVVGAFITPGPEMSSQFIVASALIGLYFPSVGLSFLVAKKKPEAPLRSD